MYINLLITTDAHYLFMSNFDMNAHRHTNETILCHHRVGLDSFLKRKF